MSAEIHLNDIGTSFNVTVYNETDTIVNLSGALVTNLLFTQPDNVLITKSGELINDGVSGVMRYVTISGDLSQIGIWQIQGYVELGSSAMYTNVSSFRVYNNL